MRRRRAALQRAAGKDREAKTGKIGVKQNDEGPLERKFWGAVSVLTFGPIAIAVGLLFFYAIFGGGGGNYDAIGLIFFFGLFMVGLVMFVSGLAQILKGAADQFNWMTLLLGGGFVIFFGSGVWQAIAADF